MLAKTMNKIYINIEDCQVETKEYFKSFPVMDGFQIEKFFEKVDKNGPLPDQNNAHYIGLDQCWIWVASFSKSGYGTVSINGWPFRAHRISKNLQSPFDPSLFALHYCDNRACVNPSHIFLGDCLANHKDREAKGRGRRIKGADHFSTILNESDILKIRELRNNRFTEPEIAKQFNVGRGCISSILLGKTWKHVK